MTTYTASQLKQNISEVLNDVQTLGWVKISNRSRPDMVMMTQSQFDEFMANRELVGAANEQEKKNEVKFGDDAFELRQCVNHSNGVFPAQLRESGVMLWNGTRITIDKFRNECSRQGFKFKVA